jgi:hypothetical protein
VSTQFSDEIDLLVADLAYFGVVAPPEQVAASALLLPPGYVERLRRNGFPNHLTRMREGENNEQ